MNRLRQTLRVANSLCIYIPVLAIAGDWVMTKTTELLVLFLFILSLIIYPIAYGRIVERLTNGSKVPWAKLLADNWWNYIVVIGLLAIPIIPFFMYVSQHLTDFDFLQERTAKYLIGIVINGLTLYVMPLVFLKKGIFSPIASGLSTLIRNPVESLPLLLTVVLIGIIKILTIFAILHYALYINKTPGTVAFMSFGFIQNILTCYLDLIIFTWATIILIDREAQSSAQPHPLF